MKGLQQRGWVLLVPLITLLVCTWAHFSDFGPESLWYQLCANLAFVGGSISATLALLFAFDSGQKLHSAGKLPESETVHPKDSDLTKKTDQLEPEKLGEKAPQKAETRKLEEAQSPTTEAEELSQEDSDDSEPEDIADANDAEPETEEPSDENQPPSLPAIPKNPSKELPPKQQRVSKRHRLPAAEEERRLWRIRQLEREVEILASMRDLSLIANDDADFEGILTRALDILQSLFEATEIQVFLVKNKAPDKLLLSALRKKKSTSFGQVDAPLRTKGSRSEALEALQKGRGGTSFVGQRMNARVVLRADQEAIGVLSMYVPSRKRGQQWASELCFELGRLAKHMALVINKPTLYDRAVLDALTGLYSKRHYLDQVPKSMGAARRLKTPLTLIIVDVDHFKSINDNHGHVTGDLVLAAVGRTIRESIRDYDAAYRYGGEEICIIAPNTDYEAGYQFAERIRLALEAQVILGDQGQKISITASFGVCICKPKQTLSQFMAVADEWLYKAKQEGRNQVRPTVKEIKSL